MSDHNNYGTFLKFMDCIYGLKINIRPVLAFDLPFTTPLSRPRTEHFRNYDEADFSKIYRMSKNTVLFVLDQINEDLEFDSDRNNSVAPVEQLLIALRFYATGNHLQDIARAHKVSVPTVSRVVRKVSKALLKLQPGYIKMPSSQEELDNSQRKFYKIAEFPYVIGCIGCTHIGIQSPGGDNAQLFRNEEGYFSLNVQTVSDAKLRVISVVTTPGSIPDPTVFKNSQLRQDFVLGLYGNSCLLCDSVYPPEKYLMTSYLQPVTDSQAQYNLSQYTTMNTVERQHEELKCRFPALAGYLRINLKTAVDVIVACCILHNICIDKGDDMPLNEMEISDTDTDIQDEQIDQNNHDQFDSYDNRRTVITNKYFSSNTG